MAWLQHKGSKQKLFPIFSSGPWLHCLDGDGNCVKVDGLKFVAQVAQGEYSAAAGDGGGKGPQGPPGPAGPQGPKGDDGEIAAAKKKAGRR